MANLGDEQDFSNLVPADHVLVLIIGGWPRATDNLILPPSGLALLFGGCDWPAPFDHADLILLRCDDLA
jgi:hypothetical protein